VAGRRRCGGIIGFIDIIGRDSITKRTDMVDRAGIVNVAGTHWIPCLA
jgi:hypothetical protein